MENIEKRVGRRSRVACKPCNRRKVRCDVTQTGSPCTNCQHESAICEVLPRKKHKPQENEERVSNLVDRATDTTTDTDGILPDDSACSYIGVPQEAYQSPSSIAPHSISGTQTTLQPHEVEYIQKEGGFSPLPSDVCDELIHCYFHHVHFFLPVIEASAFIQEYMNNGSQKINQLLFWSMLLAATNFVDSNVLQRARFASRKAMKKAMYKRAKSENGTIFVLTRAKAFYDVDRSADKLVLIQSVLLMSFWYTDAQDHTGASHWIGIAITLAQGIGIHRNPNSQVRGNSQIASEERQRLARRLWWTCVVRDRWVSLAKGRPMRIHDEDCDAPFPWPDDVSHEIQHLSAETRQRFIPPDVHYLAGMWVQLVKTSSVLGRILRAHYRLKAPPPRTQEVDELVTELLDCQPSPPTAMYDVSDIARVHEYHLQIFYQYVQNLSVITKTLLTKPRASVTVLYRPYVLNAPASFPEKSTPSWQKSAQNRAREAASATNSTLEKIIELDVVKSIKPMFITSLIPAMQIHLFDCKSDSQLQAHLAKNRLNLCLLFLDNLRDTYWSAGVMYRLFDRAQTILTSRNTTNHPMSSQKLGPTSNTPRHPNDPGNNTIVATEVIPPSIADFTPQSTTSGVLPESFSGDLENNAYSLDFAALEQLLSPGFALSDGHSQGLFTEYTGNVMGEEVPMSLYGV
ncbi:hypothetical protein N7493_010305 [Penicillium malachiteum]|uniref:Zn(2)-C6 fungal-type domain-containing protein n=1 Tax=Penicillium malachiteum TaxID=1324776 RepID=A0AAD6HCH3_9EURO|nr:hypothetical protein N7493_010305 [Penicillium malachiteum]